uniref:ATP-dependent DNA helicase n=1 Tax=Meloidogyne incognita TaxID=6306 RepID=A0A914MFS2_MELIC
MMKDEEDEELERAIRENRSPVEISLLFDTRSKLDKRLGYNVPKANEVAVVYVPGADGEVPDAKLVVRERGKELKILNSTNEMVSPMTYPLFFPRGTLGWYPDIRQDNSTRRVTRLQYVSYSIGIRKKFNPILYGGKLFQHYCVDEWVKIEGDRMRWIRSNQKTIFADAYKNVDSFLEKRARESGKPLGRKVILPPSVTNSPRYIEKHFQDAMALVRRFGKPDLFVTMTCNPQWEEIVENLYQGQVSADRPDLVDRVFYLKVKALMTEITKTKIFGRELCWMYPVENQGRGLPHIHLLLTMFDIDKVTSSEDVEKRGISARIPDKDIDKDLFDLVKKHMIHGPCGDLNPNCPCMEEKEVNGKKIRICSKGYPKPFQEETVVLENGQALYARPRDKKIVEVFVSGKRFVQKHATRAEICDLTVKRSRFWKSAKYRLSKNMRALDSEKHFAKELLDIGSGIRNNEQDEVVLPIDCISKGDLVDEIFGYVIADKNWNEMANMAIVAPNNVDVKELNNRVLNMLPEDEILYTSIDKAENEDKQVLDEYLDEFLYSLSPNGFPLHELKLKKNAIVMLIRNLNIEQGLCNGTRMLVKELRTNLIVCRLLTGDRVGQLVYIRDRYFQKSWIWILDLDLG